jgi:transcriptional regulator of acetoin/glycerol metabolism
MTGGGEGVVTGVDRGAARAYHGPSGVVISSPNPLQRLVLRSQETVSADGGAPAHAVRMERHERYAQRETDMTQGYADFKECETPDRPQVPPQLLEEIRAAARSHVPVLITGAPRDSQEIACAIDRQSRSPRGAVEVVDCRQDGALSRVMHYAATGQRAERPAAILLLQEVQALSPGDQARVDGSLAALRTGAPADRVRIMASSSAPLFDLVQGGAFDERLFYRLNVIHMVVS